MTKIQENIKNIQEQIAKLAILFHRDQNSINLLAVSKTKPIEYIKEAYDYGQKKFAESYIQEAVEKINYFKSKNINDIEWHFIGPIQSNKTNLIAKNFDVVQSVDRLKIAKRLEEQRPSDMAPLKVLIEVNISNETQKSGTSFDELPELIDFIKKAKNLQLTGFMGIATNTNDKLIIKNEFYSLKKIFDNEKMINSNITTLSMGMTNDISEAIECGSTMVRIGTAIFGARNYNR
ncbi:MAG: YggS family pyridoxal phosphate-dependent enzyme [Succinivibrionaceae bacterium]